MDEWMDKLIRAVLCVFWSWDNLDCEFVLYSMMTIDFPKNWSCFVRFSPFQPFFLKPLWFCFCVTDIPKILPAVKKPASALGCPTINYCGLHLLLLSRLSWQNSVWYKNNLQRLQNSCSHLWQFLRSRSSCWCWPLISMKPLSSTSRHLARQSCLFTAAHRSN